MAKKNIAKKEITIQTESRLPKIINAKGEEKSYLPNKKLLTDKLFMNGIMTTESIGGILPNPNTLLAKIGKSQAQLFNEMFEDDHIFAVTEVLIAGILRHPWKITSKRKSEAKRLNAMFHKLPILDVIENIVLGKLKGMSIFEIVWAYENKQYYIQDLQALDATKFSLTEDNKLIYNNTYTVFDEKYKYKFLIYRNNPYLNPYGVAEILKCYYPWMFKKSGWKFWMTTTEKYGVPTLVVDFDPSECEDVQKKADELADAFYDIDSDTVIVTNGLGKNSQGIKTIEVKAKAEEFDKLIDRAESAISKVIIGTPLLMSTSEGGSRALAEVHSNILFRHKCLYIIEEIKKVMDTLLEMESEIQTGQKNPYENRFEMEYVQIADWQKIRDAVINSIPVSKRSIYQHIDEPLSIEDTFVKEPVIKNPNYDFEKTVKESKDDDTTKRGRDDEDVEESRTETSQPGSTDVEKNA